MSQAQATTAKKIGWQPDYGFAHTIASAGQLDRLNASEGVAVRFEGLPREPVHLSFSGSQSDSLSVWQTRSEGGFISYPQFEAELVSVRFVERGVMSRIDQRGIETAISFNQVLCAAFDVMRSERAAPGFSAITATVRRGALLEAARTLGAGEALTLAKLDAVTDVDSVKLAGVRLSLYALKRQLAEQNAANLMTPLLEELFLYQLLCSWPSDMPPVPSAAGGIDRSIRKALDYIEEHLARRIMLREIAEVAGMNVRSLQSAFNQRVGCGTTAYLIGRRLDKVRAELLAGDPGTIREIANKWGFVHMSDFAERYRHRFGSLPRSERR